MKKKSILMFVVLMVMATSAMAGVINGTSYSMNIGDQVATVSFTQGPFGPGEQGTMYLTLDGQVLYTFAYTYEDALKMGTLDNGVIFFIVNDSLVLASPIATLDKDVQREVNNQ